MKQLAFIFAFHLALALLGYSQQPLPQTLWFQPLDEKLGFSKSHNYFVYQDTEGFTWISSVSGLNRFDGFRVKQYRSVAGDSTSLLDDNIQSNFFEDHQHNLWFTTYSAIHCYERKFDRFRHFQVKKAGQGISEDYRAFFLEKDSFLWVVANKEIFRFNIHTPGQEAWAGTAASFYCWAEAGKDGAVRYIYNQYPDIGNDLCFEVKDGKVTRERKWLESLPPHLYPSALFSILPESDTLIWLGTDKGLLKWNRLKNSFSPVDGFPYSKCSFVPYKDDLLVLVHQQGLFWLNRSTERISPLQTRFTSGNSITIDDFFSLFLDRTDNLWVSMQTNGLIYANLEKTKFQSRQKATSPNGDVNWNYQALCEDQDGNIWTGTSAGLFKLDKNGALSDYFQHKKTGAFSLPDDKIWSIIQDRNEKLFWIATHKGLALFDPQTRAFQRIPVEGYPDNLFFISVFQHSNGEILVTSVENGVFIVKEKSGKPVLVNIIPSEEGYTRVYEDKSGKVYICRNQTDIGIYLFKKQQLYLIDSLPVKGEINGFFEEESSKSFWVASSNGLVKIDLENLKQTPVLFTEKDGIPDKYIAGLLADKSQNLWMSTPKGLVCYDRDSLRFKTFTLSDGIQSQEFYLNAVLLRRNGELWFGGSNGITIVPPGGIRHYVTTTPGIKITGIKINDVAPESLTCMETGATNISQIRHLSLPYRDNTLSFEFVAMEYSSPAQNQLRYMLAGEDDKWVELKSGEPGFARYSNIWFGDYTFWLQGANGDGIWGQPIPVLKITIRPPFYFNKWFILFSFLALAGIIWAIVRYRINQIRERADLQTRIAENKMSALRAQMNPHFVFNSLQTINGLIARQDLRGAIEYVNQFARLMRVILENSRTNLIPLEKEIELLELYLKIEARRFSMPFTHQITVGDNLDTFSIQLPPMLLQPFVENAIKHGLFHKKAPGHISIGFIQEGNYLKCYVEDNGVGRKKSAELNMQQGRAHKSRGLEIVNERLDIIRASNPGDYHLKIIDLYDLQQNPTGTKVEIVLPLK